MTLQKAIQQEILRAGPNSKASAKEALEMIESIDKYSYDELRSLSTEFEFVVKLLFNVAKVYGRAKWQEAVEATRQAIVEDNNCPPEFKD